MTVIPRVSVVGCFETFSMANQDLILGQSRELALGQNLDSMDGPLRRVFGTGYIHDHGFNLQAHPLNFALVHPFDSELVLGHSQNTHLDPCSTGDNLNDRLPPVQNHDLEDPEDFEDENRELGTLQESELSLEEEASDESVHQHELVIHQPELDIAMAQSELASPIHCLQSLAAVPKCEIVVGQEFPDVKNCRRALRDAAISCRFEIQTVKSDKSRFTARCASDGCPWRVHAAKLSGVPTFTIRTIIDNHTCAGVTHLGHQQASVEWVANSIEESLRENPNYKPKEILEEIHQAHGIALSYKQAWRGKEKILASVRGSFEDDYRLLPLYCQQIKQTNPGSIANVYGNAEDNCFRRLFVSFYVSIYGFINACRPLIGLDRVLLKSKYLGTLLLANSFDGNGELYPLAFGVVNEENDENWIWFLSELHNLLETNTENMPRLTILSDRQKGIVDGVEFNFPTAFHGFCMHHLSDNFRKQFNNAMLVNLLWEAAQVLTVFDFESKIREIEEISQEAAFWVRRVPPRLWATAYFEGTRFGHLTANMSEPFATRILEASGLPIIQMMECVRRQLMTWFNERREASMQWLTVLVPSAEAHTCEALERARGLSVVRANEAEFEVMSAVAQPMVVDIRNRCCLCRGWQLYGLPCSHAVAALLSCRQNVHRFAENCFTVAAYRKAYSQTIHPVPDRSLWKELPDSVINEHDSVQLVVICPPKSLKPPGRLRKKRVQAEDRGRGKRVVRCSRCNQTGHFRTTCAVPV